MSYCIGVLSFMTSIHIHIDIQTQNRINNSLFIYLIHLSYIHNYYPNLIKPPKTSCLKMSKNIILVAQERI